jgi:hypothetical protein
MRITAKIGRGLIATATAFDRIVPITSLIFVFPFYLRLSSIYWLLSPQTPNPSLALLPVLRTGGLAKARRRPAPPE